MELRVLGDPGSLRFASWRESLSARGPQERVGPFRGTVTPDQSSGRHWGSATRGVSHAARDRYTRLMATYERARGRGPQLRTVAGGSAGSRKCHASIGKGRTDFRHSSRSAGAPQDRAPRPEAPRLYWAGRGAGHPTEGAGPWRDTSYGTGTFPTHRTVQGLQVGSSGWAATVHAGTQRPSRTPNRVRVPAWEAAGLPVQAAAAARSPVPGAGAGALAGERRVRSPRTPRWGAAGLQRR